jgi:pilus assembly protein CpaB
MLNDIQSPEHERRRSAAASQKAKRMKIARLVVLGIAIVAGGGAALLAGRSEAPPPAAPQPVTTLDTVDVLVAKKDVNIGQLIQAPDMGWLAWPTGSASPLYMRRTDRPDAIEQLAGAIARVPIASGEPLRESKLIKAKGSGYMAAILPEGMRAVSTEISPETGAGGFILPNDRVDVILSRRDKETERLTGIESMTAETLLSDVRVLAIDQNVEEKNGQRVVVGKTATLELTSRQTEMLAMGRLMGTLSLALRSLVDSDPAKHQPSGPVEEQGASNRVNMVRFGVSTTTIPK